jgi:hypothetical protein
MNKEEIIEANKLIAVFMGGKIKIHNISNLEYFANLSHGMSFIPPKLKYHESWDWLMPVIEKICKLKIGDGVEYVEYAYPRTFGMINDEGEFMVHLNGFQLQYGETLIEATYKAVVDFLTYYRKLK